MSYKKLEIWNLAREISIKIHELSLNQLPKFELFEEGSQIRRSSKSVRALIVEGYGKRYYKQDFIKYLICAIASNDETMDHLDTLFETKSLTDSNVYNSLAEQITLLGKKMNLFIEAVKKQHISENNFPVSASAGSETGNIIGKQPYLRQSSLKVAHIQNPVSRIQYPESRIQNLKT